MTTEYLTPDQYRYAYSPPIGRDAVFKMLRDGTIKSIRRGRRYLIPRSEIEDFLQRQLEGTGDSIE